MTRAAVHHLTLKTLFKISVRHWLNARWSPAAVNDNDDRVPA